ncbi:cytosolic phospholipase A2 zeta-like [Colossoma macropomum]|uniref:cytosolic phospholipase A2 zeta-like n=1 Tax=Colossoma macropomum TaxID=42526 RepID=UPI0018651351|nr:cytosolic phospholipase A2 zeta-like [Colossoma macropomum]XP_036423206.1 cytosolic phospholipase A2 zeta-like [Colossoma macropomum]XP_036423207.1 cytosolic phospholipase A2 zeta-like [Colossoma macropomum]
MDLNKWSSESEVRIGHSLNEAERQHLARRRETVLQCLKQHGITCSEDKMPNIAVLGSGGGLRAMLGLLGSLNQLKEDGLLDCIMYLCGVSGSTWCMASLYKELDWSTKLETVKENIVQRLAEGSVSWWKMGQKLTKYYSEKDNFSLTDVWSALIVSHMVKEIDEHKITEQRGNYTNDPYPIYTVIDKQCKHDQLNADPWFEITPDESGYSLSGAFVDSSCWGSEFKKGKKMKDQPETDMLYLQGLCGSAIADMEENLKYLYEALKHLITDKIGSTEKTRTPLTPDVKNGCQVLLTLVELNLCVLKKEDPAVYLQTLQDLLKGQRTLRLGKLKTSEGTISKTDLKDLNLHVCNSVSVIFSMQRLGDRILNAIVKAIEKMTHWIWGTTYDYLYKMKVEGVHPSVLHSEKREYEDAGLLLNSPYFSVLRKERDIDLIISLDYSSGNPFETVLRAAEMCKALHIPFPEVSLPAEDTETQDFYVFRGYSKAPTVIHMPLFNAVNCKGEIEKWEKIYQTFNMSYDHKRITDLLEKAGLNIKNNKDKLLKEIQNVIDGKNTSKLG